MGLVVRLHIVLVQKFRGHKDIAVVISINISSAKIHRHNRNVDGAMIFDFVLEFFVFITNERLQVDSVNQDGVQEETESVADPENFSCSLDDVTRLSAAVPDNKGEEL